MSRPAPPLLDAEVLLDRAPCGVLLTQTDGLIVHVNSTFCQWLGYTADQLIGHYRLQDLLNTAGRVFHQTYWAPFLQMRRSIAEVKLDITHHNGSTVPMLINASRRSHGDQEFDELAMLVVTERHRYENELLLARKKAEQAADNLREADRALRASRDVLSLAMRGAHMGLWSRDLVNHQTTWSHELEALLGLEPGSLANADASFLERIHPDDRPTVNEVIERVRMQHSDFILEFRLRHASGEWRWMEGRGRAIYDSQGKPLGLHGLVIDISRRKSAEAQLQFLNRQLSDADQRKDEFLATLAHELRNPLAPLRNVLELLQLKEFNDPQLVWARNVFDRQLRHITHLVDDLLEVSRITQGKLELRTATVELADVMSGAADASRPTIMASSHELVVNLPSEPLLLKADPIRLSQMIQNLLNNAAKYTPAGGRIRLAAERDTADPTQVAITVQDSGIGIAPQHLDAVFEMFSQLAPALDRSQGGLGIGLSLVKALAELHGGTVTAHSPGVAQGSTFTLRLPLLVTNVAADAAANAIGDGAVDAMADAGSNGHEPAKADAGAAVLPPPSACEKAPLETCRIAVVDDNEDAATSLAMVLELSGHEVRTAGDGLSGVALVKSFAPDVVILDIGMPDINGYEVARRIRRMPGGKHLLLMALTGWGQEHDKREARAAGFDHHFTKPLDFEALSLALAGFIDDRRRLLKPNDGAPVQS